VLICSPSRIFLSRLAIGLFIAVSVVHQGIAGSDQKTDSSESDDGASKPPIEKREAGVVNQSVGRNALGSTRKTKDDDLLEKNRRGDLLILILQILRSPK
jgi:hypothetical protein